MGEADQFKNTPEMNKILKDPNGVPRRIFVYGVTPQDGQIDRFRSEMERTFRKYGLIEGSYDYLVFDGNNNSMSMREGS